MAQPIVCKFGGSSVANAEQIRKVEDIVKSDPKRRYIVVSAPGKDKTHPHKVTDILYNMYFKKREYAFALADVKYPQIELSFNELAQELKDVFNSIVAGLALDGNLCKKFTGELEEILADRNKTHHDFVSRGENFNARLIAAYLNADFADAAGLIHTNSRSPDGDNESTREWISKLNPPGIVVIPGFYANDTLYRKKPSIRTFSRGGSDLTGSLIAAFVNASVYENWTDQPGIRCCDPRLFEQDERDSIPVIDRMSYKETRELTYMGFEVFNDESLGPVRKRNIPVNIRNTNYPSAPGTLISSEYNREKPIRGIAGRNGFCAISLEKYLMNKEVGFGERLLRVIADNGLSYEHSPSGIDNISVILEQDKVKDMDCLVKEISSELRPDKIDVLRDLALIAVVGEGMRHTVGIASRITSALADNGINIEILNQGASESNIIIGVKSEDYKNAIRALYNRLLK